MELNIQDIQEFINETRITVENMKKNEQKRKIEKIILDGIYNGLSDKAIIELVNFHKKLL